MAEFLSFIKRMIMALVAVGLLSFLLEISQMLIIPVIENALPGADLRTTLAIAWPLAFICLLIYSWFLFKYRRNFVRMIAKLEPEVKSAQALILGISLPPVQKGTLNDQEKKEREILSAYPLSCVGAPKAEIEEDEAYYDALKHVWVQALRAVRKHEDTLKRITIIPSSKTWCRAEELKTLILDCAKHDDRTFDIVISPDQVKDCPDYGHYESVRNSIEKEIRELIKLGIKEKNICIDATAGQKPFSIAAAAVTFSRECLFSYVDTNNWDVRLFNGQVNPDWSSPGFMGSF